MHGLPVTLVMAPMTVMKRAIMKRAMLLSIYKRASNGKVSWHTCPLAGHAKTDSACCQEASNPTVLLITQSVCLKDMYLQANVDAMADNVSTAAPSGPVAAPAPATLNAADVIDLDVAAAIILPAQEPCDRMEQQVSPTPLPSSILSCPHFEPYCCNDDCMLKPVLA